MRRQTLVDSYNFDPGPTVSPIPYPVPSRLLIMIQIKARSQLDYWYRTEIFTPFVHGGGALSCMKFVTFPNFLTQMPLWREKKKVYYFSGNFCFGSVKSPMHARVKGIRIQVVSWFWHLFLIFFLIYKYFLVSHK